MVNDSFKSLLRESADAIAALVEGLPDGHEDRQEAEALIGRIGRLMLGRPMTRPAVVHYRTSDDAFRSLCGLLQGGPATAYTNLIELVTCGSCLRFLNAEIKNRENDQRARLAWHYDNGNGAPICGGAAKKPAGGFVLTGEVANVTCARCLARVVSDQLCPGGRDGNSGDLRGATAPSLPASNSGAGGGNSRAP
ncbi:MAG: hypothetical protein ACX939_03010 [Hyphococcus sp.]